MLPCYFHCHENKEYVPFYHFGSNFSGKVYSSNYKRFHTVIFIKLSAFYNRHLYRQSYEHQKAYFPFIFIIFSSSITLMYTYKEYKYGKLCLIFELLGWRVNTFAPFSMSGLKLFNLHILHSATKGRNEQLLRLIYL